MENNVETPKANDPAGKILTRIESVVLAVVFVSIAFKIMFWPGAGLLSIAGWRSLSFVYFLLWIKPVSEKRAAPNILLSVAAFMGMSVAAMGILFKLLFWPGAHFMMWAGMFAGFITLVLCAIGLLMENSAFHKPTIIWVLKRQVPIMILLLILSFVNQIAYYRTLGPLGDDEKFMKLYEDCHTKRINCEQKRAYEDSVYNIRYRGNPDE